jgi:hypothetical protein
MVSFITGMNAMISRNGTWSVDCFSRDIPEADCLPDCVCAAQGWEYGDDTATPVLDDLFYLVDQDFAGQSEIPLIFFPEPDGDFQFLQFLKRNR